MVRYYCQHGRIAETSFHLIIHDDIVKWVFTFVVMKFVDFYCVDRHDVVPLCSSVLRLVEVNDYVRYNLS